MNAEEIARELCKRVFPSRIIEGLEDYPRMARALTKLPEEIAAALTAASAQIKETEALGIESAQRAFSLRLENNALRARLAAAREALKPFDTFYGTYPADRFPDDEIVSIRVKFGDLRRARERLAEMEKL